MQLFELFDQSTYNISYQEEEPSTFTHNDQLYDLNKLFRLTDQYDTELVSVDKLLWILEWDFPQSWERVDQADIAAPILVTISDGQYVILDGLHRLVKTLKYGLHQMPSKMVSEEILMQCLIIVD